MSRPVDVLAVMDDAAHKLAHGTGTPAAQMAVAAELREARAAVAELVEAARTLSDEVRKIERPWHLSGGAENYGFDHGKADAAELVEKKIAAALAKFGSAN